MSRKEWFVALVLYCVFLGTCVVSNTSRFDDPELTNEHVNMCIRACGKLGVNDVQPDDCDCNDAPRIVEVEKWRACPPQ